MVNLYTNILKAKFKSLKCKLNVFWLTNNNKVNKTQVNTKNIVLFIDFNKGLRTQNKNQSFIYSVS